MYNRFVDETSQTSRSIIDDPKRIVVDSSIQFLQNCLTFQIILNKKNCRLFFASSCCQKEWMIVEIFHSINLNQSLYS